MKLCASRARGRTLQPLVVDSQRAPCHRCPIRQQMACEQCSLPWGEVAPHCARGHCGAFSSNGRGGFLVKSPAWLVVGAPIAATAATNQAPVRIAGDVVATRLGV